LRPRVQEAKEESKKVWQRLIMHAAMLKTDVELKDSGCVGVKGRVGFESHSI
jgi:hypothetical protein